MNTKHIQYIHDETDQTVSVIVPIDRWRDIESERETAYLLRSDTLKRRLLDAKNRQDGILFDYAYKTFGV